MECTVLESVLDVHSNEIVIPEEAVEAWFELPAKGTVLCQGRKLSYLRIDDAERKVYKLKFLPIFHGMFSGDHADVKIVKNGGELVMHEVKPAGSKRALVSGGFDDEGEVRFNRIMHKLAPTQQCCRALQRMVSMFMDNQMASLDDEVDSYRRFLKRVRTSP